MDAQPQKQPHPADVARRMRMVVRMGVIMRWRAAILTIRRNIVLMK